MRKYILALILLTSCVGAFAQNKFFTVVFLNNKPDKEVLSKEKSDSVMQGHMNNIGVLAKEHKLCAAGPFEGGGGLFVMCTGSVNQANEWLATDPGVKAKRWNIEVFAYMVNSGSFCMVEGKYEMVLYPFVRFTYEKNVTAESLQEHREYVHKLISKSVIHEGIFTDKSGEFLILKPNTAREIIEADPAVKNGLIKFELKTLYIAKESLCQN